MMKMMKKVISVFAALVLLTLLCACNNADIDSEIVGTWEYSNHSELKDLLTDVFDEGYFYKVYYQFNADGTGATWLESGENLKGEFTYEFSGNTLTIYMPDGSAETLQCDLNGDKFSVSDNEESMIFKRIK